MEDKVLSLESLITKLYLNLSTKDIKLYLTLLLY